MTMKTLPTTITRVAMVAVLGLAAAGCSDTEETPPASVPETTPGDAGMADDDEDGDTEDAQAATVDSLPYTEELDGRRLSVLSFGATTSGSEFWEVAEGNEAVFVEVRVENVDAEPWESNVVQFFLFDEAGAQYAPEFYESAAGEPPAAEVLEVGDSVEGFVPFEVPADVTGLRLEYAVDLSVNAIIHVQLN